MSQIRSSLSLSTVSPRLSRGDPRSHHLGWRICGRARRGVGVGIGELLLCKPFHTLDVARPDDVVALIAFLLFAVSASVIVNRFAERTHEADRARAEAQILAGAAASVAASHEDLQPLLEPCAQSSPPRASPSCVQAKVVWSDRSREWPGDRRLR